MAVNPLSTYQSVPLDADVVLAISNIESLLRIANECVRTKRAVHPDLWIISYCRVSGAWQRHEIPYRCSHRPSLYSPVRELRVLGALRVLRALQDTHGSSSPASSKWDAHRLKIYSANVAIPLGPGRQDYSLLQQA